MDKMNNKMPTRRIIRILIRTTLSMKVIMDRMKMK